MHVRYVYTSILYTYNTCRPGPMIFGPPGLGGCTATAGHSRRAGVSPVLLLLSSDSMLVSKHMGGHSMLGEYIILGFVGIMIADEKLLSTKTYVLHVYARIFYVYVCICPYSYVYKKIYAEHIASCSCCGEKAPLENELSSCSGPDICLVSLQIYTCYTYNIRTNTFATGSSW